MADSNIRNIVVFSDFDGTITRKDLGDDLFVRFGRFEPYHSELVAGRLHIYDYWRIMFENLAPSISKEDIAQYAREQEVDPYFKMFAAFCQEAGYPLYVISDGFDIYIKEVLKGQVLDNIGIRCNRAVTGPDGRLMPEYPYASESCSCKCASCKRNSILNIAPPDSIIVYIGDGYSDFCAAEHADIIFAKKDLAAYCNKHRLPHYPFSGFFDVLRTMKDVLPKKKIKTRNQAAMNRKRAFETE